jgi:hypothetical protein
MRRECAPIPSGERNLRRQRSSLAALIAILVAANFPPDLHRLGVGVLPWGIRVEACLLLLHHDYPPLSLDE